MGKMDQNGLYQYSTTATYPTNAYNSSNYWVDAVFSGVVAADITPPTVTSTSPSSGATGVSTGTGVNIFF